MNEYTALATVAFSPGMGNLRLTPEQAAPLSNSLVQTGTPDVYTIVGLVQFKQGERFGWDGTPSAAMLKRMVPVTT